MSAYGAYVERKSGDVIFNGYINGKFPKYVIIYYLTYFLVSDATQLNNHISSCFSL